MALAVVSASPIQADPPVTVPVPTLSAPTNAPWPHLTDEQDQMGNGSLKRSAEDKSRANALYAEAMLEDPENHPRQSLEKLREVVALDPHFTDAQVKIANLMLQGGQLDAALDQLKSAASTNPDSVDIEAALGYTLHLHGQNDEALRLGRSALAKDPTQATAMRTLLEVAGDKNDLPGGVAHIEEILVAEDARVPASAWLTFASLYGDTVRALPHPPAGEAILKTLLTMYEHASAKPPPDVDTLILLADAYRDLGNKRDAMKTLQEASALDPSNLDILLRIADLETELGLKAEALKNYEQALILNPNLTDLRDRLVQLYIDDKRFADAARLLKDTIFNAPNSCPPETYLKLAVIQVSLKEINEAGATLAEAQKRFPQSAKIRFYEAIQHRYEKNYDAALECLDQARALAVGPDADVLDIGFYLESALTMNLAHRKDRLEPTLREGLAKFPDSPDLMNELAYFLAEDGTHLPEALDLIRRANDREPDSGPLIDTCGWVYFKMGRPKDALPYLQRAAILTNNDPVVLQHLGDTYLKLGLKSDAIAAWRHALEKDPRNGDLAGRIDAALAQANHAHTRSAPTP